MITMLQKLELSDWLMSSYTWEDGVRRYQERSSTYIHKLYLISNLQSGISANFFELA